MPISVVNHGTAIQTASSSSFAFTVPTVTAGNALVIGAFLGNAPATFSGSDNVNTGKPYLVDVTGGLATDGDACAILSLPGQAGGNTTVTLTASIAGGWFVTWAEVAGLATSSATDKTAAANSTGTAASSGNTATTTVANEFVFSFLGLSGVGGGTTVGAGSTTQLDTLANPGSGHQQIADGYQIVSTTGTYAGQYTVSIGTEEWAVLVATYQGAGGSSISASLSEAGSAADSVAVIGAYAAALSENGAAIDQIWILIPSNYVVPSNRPRPGRGPFSQGKFHVQRIDAYATGPRRYDVGLSEIGSAADAVSAQLAAVSTLSESGAATDGLSILASVLGALSETGSAADSLSAAAAAVGALAELGSAADSLTAALAGVAAIAESDSAIDVITVALAAISSLSEAGSAADTLSWGGNIYSVSIAETAAASDSIGAALMAVAAIADAGSAADVVSAQAALVSALTEAGAAVDSLSALAVMTVVIAEQGNAADVISWVAATTPGAERIVVLPYGRRIAVIAYQRRITVDPS